MKFFGGTFTGNSWLDFDGDPDHGNFYTEFLPFWDRGNCKNFASNFINND